MKALIDDPAQVLKNSHKNWLFGAAMICTIALAVSTTIAQPRNGHMTVDDLMRMKRVGSPQLSPDGKWIAYTVNVPYREANRGDTQIFLMSIEGGEPKQLTAELTSAIEPRWSPDGKRLAFVTDGQIWTMNLDGADRRQLTTISTEAYDPVWASNGQLIAFVSDVYPDCADDECNRQRNEQAYTRKVQGRTNDQLLYRHWTTWRNDTRTHVFVVSLSGGPARDLTPGDYDAPPFSWGGQIDYSFSPDSKDLAFVRNSDKAQEISTNSDIWLVSVEGGPAKNITASNHGYDGSPRFSPDGRFIAYRSQTTPGFASDRLRLVLYDRRTGQTRSLTERFDSWVDEYVFSPDSKWVYFAAEERGQEPIYSVSVNGGAVMKIVSGFNGNINVSADGKTLVFSRSSMIKANEIYRSNADGSGVTALTQINEMLLAPLHLKPAEELTWTGAGNVKISGWLVKPAGFQRGKKYPLLVLIHDGPQSAWYDNWSYRWNAQIFAGAGYVVFMPNPRGSTGYGQQFINEVSGDWGGKAYADTMNGVAHVIDLGIVDTERIGAAGAGYGGYMVNWIEGHNNDRRFQFRALVAHAGIFNLTSWYGETDELWFPEWEFKGTPWSNPNIYARWSPNAFVKNFKTPLLLTHGQQDYSVPIEQSLELFTALQLRGVESKLVVFDDGHWISKPQNSAMWYTTVIEWFNQQLKPQRVAREESTKP